jgi:hypothetical protein
MFRFTIRDLLWLTVVVGLWAAWRVSRIEDAGQIKRMGDEIFVLKWDYEELRKTADRDARQVKSLYERIERTTSGSASSQ